MTRAPRTCPTPGCTVRLRPGQSCSRCRRDSDRARGTASQRGYTSPEHLAFRTDVLDRDPICVLCRLAASTVADHHPLSRRELIAAGLDPNDPAHGRGLCKACHDASTAQLQPGGWNNRPVD